MRTPDPITVMLFAHVAIPTQDLQVVRVSESTDNAPPFAGMVLGSIFFPVFLVIHRQEWTARLATANTLPAIVGDYFQADRSVSSIRLSVPPFAVGRLSNPSRVTCITVLTLRFSAPRLATSAQSTFVALALPCTSFIGAFGTLALPRNRRTVGARVAASACYSAQSPFVLVLFVVEHSAHCNVREALNKLQVEIMMA